MLHAQLASFLCYGPDLKSWGLFPFICVHYFSVVACSGSLCLLVRGWNLSLKSGRAIGLRSIGPLSSPSSRAQIDDNDRQGREYSPVAVSSADGANPPLLLGSMHVMSGES
jgi:hypothetical protein